MKNVVNDTCEVIFRRLSDGYQVATTEAQLASISQSAQEDQIRGGIGNGVIATIRSAKDVQLTVRNALFDHDWLSMSQGTAFQNGSVVVTDHEEGVLTDNAGSLEYTLVGTPSTNADVWVEDTTGSKLEATYSSGTVTVTDTNAQAGDTVIVFFEKDATGDILNIDADKFSEAWSVEYHTVEYSAETNKVVKDLYFKFGNVTPSDNFDLSFENGNAIAPELNFTAKKPVGSQTIGQIIEVDRP